MSAFYYKMAKTAKNLIRKYGQAVSITRTTGEVINPVTGVTTAGTTETFLPNGILKPYNDDLVDGTRILKTDLELTLDDTVKPMTSDKPIVNSEIFTVVGNVEISPAGTPLIYKLQVRK